MPPRTPYEIFGLPEEKFRLDEKLLRERYDRLRTQFHPDRFAAATPAERRAAESMAADLNEAWRILKDPLMRAAWLLTKRGSNPFAEIVEATPSPEFLEWQIELRERLEEISNEGNWMAAREFVQELDMEIRQKMEGLEMMLDTQPDVPGPAVLLTQELKYLMQCERQAWNLSENGP